MISATPSPVTSPAATLTPPANAGSYAKKLATSVTTPPARLKARTCGPPPGPAPVMMSATPSPVTSPAATLTPPANAGSYAKKLATSVMTPVPASLRISISG